MGRGPCCSKEGLNRGAWSAMEDKILTDYIKVHGEGKWRNLPERAGLKRCGKSCRLRWLNYLRPDIKRGNISRDEEDLIIRLHKLLGNRWSLIAGRIPGRTDNEIKNYWNTIIVKKVQAHPSTSSTRKSSSSTREHSQPDPPTLTIDPSSARHPPSTEPLGGSEAAGPSPDADGGFFMDLEMENFLSDFMCSEFAGVDGRVEGCVAAADINSESDVTISTNTSSSESYSGRTLWFIDDDLDGWDLTAGMGWLDEESETWVGS